MPGRAAATCANAQARNSVSPRPSVVRWVACSYSAVRGRFMCPGGAEVGDGMTTLLNDDQGDWPFTTPSIEITAATSTDIRIELDAHLAGTYWAAAAGTVVALAIDDGAPRHVGAQVPLEIYAGARLTLTTTVTGRTVFAMVHRDTLVPPRPHRREPPATAPF